MVNNAITKGTHTVNTDYANDQLNCPFTTYSLSTCHRSTPLTFAQNVSLFEQQIKTEKENTNSIQHCQTNLPLKYAVVIS